MKDALVILVAAMGMTLAIVSGSAAAQPDLTSDEANYVAALAAGGSGAAPIVPGPGFTASDLARLGHMIADDVRHGVDPIDEQHWIMQVNASQLTYLQWTLVVVTAVKVFAPDFARWYFDPGTGPVYKEPLNEFWPPGAVESPYGCNHPRNPGFPPFISDRQPGLCVGY